jgi:SpoVK/Ycf46/Vps4 family AAA+-type ATPase
MDTVFLRLLEYFEGILFLTTNRIDTIDPAFESRIHITMHLDNLDATGRQQIWHNFLDGFDLKPEEEQAPSDRKKVVVKQGEKQKIIDNFKSLAEKELNGRQIRNTFNVARAFASTDKYDPGFLTLQHLEDASVQAMALKNYFEREKGVRVKEEYRSIWSPRRQ